MPQNTSAAVQRTFTYNASLSHRRAVGDLSLFCRYSDGFCSSELISIIPPLSKPARCTSVALTTLVILDAVQRRLQLSHRRGKLGLFGRKNNL
nr:unnamed protein product [Callosobruchus chinensis]